MTIYEGCSKSVLQLTLVQNSVLQLEFGLTRNGIVLFVSVVVSMEINRMHYFWSDLHMYRDHIHTYQELFLNLFLFSFVLCRKTCSSLKSSFFCVFFFFFPLGPSVFTSNTDIFFCYIFPFFSTSNSCREKQLDLTHLSEQISTIFCGHNLRTILRFYYSLISIIMQHNLYEDKFTSCLIFVFDFLTKH